MNTQVVAQIVLEFEKSYQTDSDEGKRFQKSRLELLLALSVGGNNEFDKIHGERYGKEAKKAAELILERIKEKELKEVLTL